MRPFPIYWDSIYARIQVDLRAGRSEPMLGEEIFINLMRAADLWLSRGLAKLQAFVFHESVALALWLFSVAFGENAQPHAGFCGLGWKLMRFVCAFGL